MSPMQAVIFDVDGVLVASPHERAWQEALADLMTADWRAIVLQTRYAPERFTTSVYQQYVAGRPRLSGARAILDFFGVPDPAARAVGYAQRKQQHIDRLIDVGAFEAFPDAVRFALALTARGVRLGVASSSRNADRFMERVRLDTFAAAYGPGPPVFKPNATLRDIFAANVCGRDVPRGKPDPDIFLLAAHELGVLAEASVVIEDAPAGVQAAKSGGMRAIGVARLQDDALLEAAGADLVVRTLDEVAVDRLRDGYVERRPTRIEAGR